MAIPTVVQATNKSNSSSTTSAPNATFGSTPTSGNTLVALIWISQGPAGGGPVPNTGWALQQSSGPGTGFASWWGLYTRTAGASEPTSQTPESVVRDYWNCAIWEINGLGSWSAAFQAWHNDPTNNLGSATLLTTSFNTAVNNELVLLSAAGYSNTAGITISSSNGTSDSSSTSTGGTDAFGTSDDGHAYHFNETTAGTSIQSTLTQTANNNTAIAYAYVELINASSSTETATADMALGGVAFSSAATVVQESGTASLALTHVSFNAAGSVIPHESATATLVLNAVSFMAGVIDFIAGSIFNSFSTFGA